VSPTVSIVVRCRDEARHLPGVLAAVFAQEGAPSFEVVALDSGSRDGTLALLARHPVRIEHLDGRFTFGRALNLGTRLAAGDLVVYLSAHSPPLATRWLVALVAPFSDPATVASFGRQAPLPGVNPIEAIALARTFPPAPPAGVRFSASNAAVRRAAVLARPFDEEIPAAEDHLWACGIGPGERIAYVPEAVVGHSHPMTFAAWRNRFYIDGQATAYARVRGIAMPWRSPDHGARSAAAFARLVATLVRHGELRALLRLPAYALARGTAYARGQRDFYRRETMSGSSRDRVSRRGG
jgi:glycosyltransferase involved in cell wall biosynthesis